MKRTPRMSPFVGLILSLCFVLQGMGCITPFFDPDRYEGARIKLATKYNTLMAEQRYADVVALAEQHLDPDDPFYRDAIYYMYQARLRQIRENNQRAEQARKLRNQSVRADADDKMAMPESPEELPTRPRKEIQGNQGFTEPLVQEPTGEMREKLLSKIPVLNVIDTDLDYVVYEIFKNSGIKFIVDPGLLQDRKISVRVTDETVLGFLDYLRTTQGIDYSIYGNTLRLHPLNTGFTTRIFRLRHGFQPNRLSRDFQSLSDLSFINRANESGGGGGGGGAPGGGSGAEDRRSFIEAISENLETLVDWTEGSSYYVDRKNNMVVVRSTPSTLEQVGKLLEAVDILPTQIQIESRFIEVRDMSDFDFGTNLAFEGITFGSQGGDLGKILVEEGTGTFFGSQLTNAAGERTGTNVLLSGTLDDGEFQAAIFVLDRLSTAETLSSPSVTCANNSTATLAVVQNLVYIEEYRVETGNPISQGDGGGIGTEVFEVPSLVATINDENFEGFVLNVTPSVGSDGENIGLTVQPVVRAQVDSVTIESSAVLATGSDSLGGDSFVAPDIERPILETRFVNTNLTVKDGSTVVIGGLTRFVELTNEDKVPFLGDIPILGRLFRRDTRIKDKRNLLIFVTAKIINPEGGFYTDPVETLTPNPATRLDAGADMKEN